VPIRHLAFRVWRPGGLSVIAAVATLAILPAVPAAPARPPAAAASPVASPAAPARPAAGTVASTRPVPAVIGLVNAQVQLPTPEPTSQCLSTFGINCYSPLQYRAAYNLGPLYANGITGSGRTIVIVDSFGSPTIKNDLHVFDTQFGIPDPDLQIYKAGKIPAFDRNDATMVGWADETTLDVEYAHAIAPGARIVLVETPVAETEGVTGFPEMMKAEKALIDRGIGDVISQSFGATENTFPGFSKGDYTSLYSLRYAFNDAYAHRVTVLASSGDAGATDAMADGTTLYTTRVNSWPSSDPLVTSVGGSQLDLDNSGKRLQPDTVWNDGFGAGGGGDSAVFRRPLFQTGVAGTVGDHRGTPDISMSAAVNGGCWVYESFAPVGAGWEIFGGTSEATPIFAGIVALADQAAGRRLGDVNAALYTLGALNQTGRAPFNTGIVDITTGDNSFAAVVGFKAAAGYDMASGWGTVDGNAFVRALAHVAG
jgi:subtilase family serine protease